jgi:hypothetical protein
MTSRTNLSRRNAANLAALRSGVPADQAGIDALWGGIVARHNASLPTRAQPDLNSTPSPRPASRALQGQAEIDSMWGSIATGLTAEAGLTRGSSR